MQTVNNIRFINNINNMPQVPFFYLCCHDSQTQVDIVTYTLAVIDRFGWDLRSMRLQSGAQIHSKDQIRLEIAQTLCVIALVLRKDRYPRDRAIGVHDVNQFGEHVVILAQ